MERGKLFLVKPQADNDTVEVLTELRDAATRGEIVGLIYVALHRGSGYSGDVVGVAKDNPILCRGLVGTLWDKLATTLRTR